MNRSVAIVTDRNVNRQSNATEGRPSTKPAPRIPRISKLTALAIRFNRMLRAGIVANQTELAKLVNVSQPRITQILKLNVLAPDIQEELLFLPAVTAGRNPVHEKMLRPIVAEVCWGRQRELWVALNP